MTLDVIKTITEAEKKGEKIVADSVSRTKEILSKAEEEEQRILENKLKEGEKEAFKIIEQTEKEIQEIVKKIYMQVEKEGNAIRNAADSKINVALNFIIEKVVKSSGNS